MGKKKEKFRKMHGSHRLYGFVASNRTGRIFVTVPPCKYFSIKGSGNPNNPYFAEYIGVLYALSYAVKMNRDLPND